MSCGLRDVLSFEADSKPAVLVASSAFKDAAEHQAAALGQPDVRAEIAERCDAVIEALAD